MLFPTVPTEPIYISTFVFLQPQSYYVWDFSVPLGMQSIQVTKPVVISAAATVM